MTGMDFVKAFEWAMKHPSAYAKYAKTENPTPTEEDNSPDGETPEEDPTDNQTEERI